MRTLILLMIVVGVVSAGLFITKQVITKTQTAEDYVVSTGQEVRENSVLSVYKNISSYPDGVYCKRLKTEEDESVLVRHNAIRFFGQYDVREKPSEGEQGICREDKLYIWDDDVSGDIFRFATMTPEAFMDMCAYILDQFEYKCYQAQIDPAIVKKPLGKFFVVTTQ